MSAFSKTFGGVLCVSILLGACAQLGEIVNSTGCGTTPGAQLSRAEVMAGLKEALSTGARTAVEQAAREGGFSNDARLRIPVPSELTSAVARVEKLGLGALTRDFRTSLNRGAEEASKLAFPILRDAIVSMSIEDAWSVLRSEDPRAATAYMRKATEESLTNAFRPRVKESLEKVQATRYWGDIASRYNSLPLVTPVRADLDTYVTERALAGLFELIAVEETKIRASPMDYASQLLRRVFGSLKN